MSSLQAIALITAPDTRSADRLTTHLLEKKLAACVNQIPQVRSRYWWKGKIESCREILLVVKTRSSLIPEIAQSVKKIHPYSVPEVISVQLSDGYKPYLQWIDDSTEASRPRARKR